MQENKWYMYILRYKYSGNYYVGITQDLDKRMHTHFLRQSQNKGRLPEWSQANRSIMGFKSYWFDLLENSETKSRAAIVENTVTKILKEQLKNIQGDNVRFHAAGGDQAVNRGADIAEIDSAILLTDPIVQQMDGFISNLAINNSENLKLKFLWTREF